MSNRISVLVVDDHPVVRHGLQSMLSSVEDLEVVGEAGNGASALVAAERLKPDVVLLDVRMPGPDGIQVVQQMKKILPDTHVVMLTVHDDPAYASRSLEAGADGFLLKKAGLEEIADAIRTVHGGRVVVGAEVAGELLGKYAALARENTLRDARLSDPELKILQGMSQGATYRNLSSQLFMSEISVRRKVQEIYQKLGVSDRAEAVAVAIRRGLI